MSELHLPEGVMGRKVGGGVYENYWGLGGGLQKILHLLMGVYGSDINWARGGSTKKIFLWAGGGGSMKKFRDFP